MSLGTGLEIGPANQGILGECFSSATNVMAETLGIKQAPAQDQSFDVAADGDIHIKGGMEFVEKGDRLYYMGVLQQGGGTGTGNHVTYGPGQSPKPFK